MKVPEGWTSKKIGELGRWRGGGTPSKANPDFWSRGTIPWVSPKDMKSRVVHDAEDWITGEAVRDSATSLIPANSLIVVTRSGILRHSLPAAINSRDVTINQDIKALTPLKDYDTYYIASIFWSLEKDLLDKCQKDGTTVESIDFDSLKNYSISLPPLPEQRKIAAILSIWDDSLSTLTRLIDTKRQQKRALAEQLLTGKRRLNGFEGERKMKKFGEIFITVSAKSLQIEKSEYQAVGEIAVIDQGQKNVAAYVSGRPAFLDIPVIVFGDHTRTIKWIDFPFAPGADGTVLLKTFPGMENKYGFYILEVLNIPNLGYSRHLKLLKEMVFSIPTLPEQQVITSILTTLDDEISALERLQVSVQEQKRGLMDALLTGRVRVNVEDA